MQLASHTISPAPEDKPEHNQSFPWNERGKLTLGKKLSTPFERSPSESTVRKLTYASGTSCSLSEKTPVEVRSVAHIPDPDIITFTGYYFDKSAHLNLILARRFCYGIEKDHLMVPRRYLLESSRERDLGAAVRNLSHRMQITSKSEPKLLGGSTVPLPGILPAVEFSFSGEVVADSFRPRAVFDKFYGPLTFQGVRSKELIKNLLRGKYNDLHALHAAISIENHHGIRTEVPEDVRASVGGSRIQRLIPGQISTADRLEELLLGQPPPGVPLVQEWHPTTLPDSGFIQVHSKKFLRTYRGFPKFEHEIIGDIVQLDQKLDTQAVVLGYVRGRGADGAPDIHLLMNVGGRQLISRELQRHPIQSHEPDRSIEPWSFYTSGMPEGDEVKERLTAMSGVRTIGEPLHLGSFYQNPEFVNLKSELYLVEIDAESMTPQPNVPDTWQTLVSLNEVRKAGEEGIIKSLPLVVGAEVVGRASGYLFKDQSLFCLQEELDSFNQKLRVGSEFRDMIDHNFSPQLEQIAHSETLYRLLEHLFNAGFGLKEDGDEFYSCVPEYGVLAKLPPLQRFILFLHDGWHGEQGDLIPWRFEDSKAVLLPRREYVRGILTNEAGSVYFSEVVLAKRYGYDQWRRETGEFSLGEALSICGLEKNDARRAIVSMVREGRIPDAVRLHPRFDEFKDTITYFLGYHFRDCRNAEQSYEYWKNHPEVARAVLEFNERCTNRLGHHVKNVYQTSSRLKNEQCRGINPFKHEINKLAITDLLKEALRIGYLKDICSDPQIAAELDSMYEELKKERELLLKAASAIRGIEVSSRNVRALRIGEAVKERLEETKSRLTVIADRLGLSPEEQQRVLHGIPLWKSSFELESSDKEKLSGRVRSELARMGLPAAAIERI